jgi:hypothetical protein
MTKTFHVGMGYVNSFHSTFYRSPLWWKYSEKPVSFQGFTHSIKPAYILLVHCVVTSSCSVVFKMVFLWAIIIAVACFWYVCVCVYVCECACTRACVPVFYSYEIQCVASIVGEALLYPTVITSVLRRVRCYRPLRLRWCCGSSITDWDIPGRCSGRSQ